MRNLVFFLVTAFHQSYAEIVEKADVEVPNADSAKAEESPNVTVIKLNPGQPLLHQDLEQYTIICFSIGAPKSKRIAVLASVVGLTGNPNVATGWKPMLPGQEPATDGGFQTISKEVDHDLKDGDNYYICVTTYSAQGCDFVITSILRDPSWDETPPLWLRPSYPGVWPLSKEGPTRGVLQFRLPITPLEDVHVSAVPIVGKINLVVYRYATCTGTPLRNNSLEGPDIIDLSHAELKDVAIATGPAGNEWAEPVCLEVKGTGSVAITAGPKFPGPFIVQAVPTAGRLSSKMLACERFRLLLNENVDLTVTAVTEDGSGLAVFAGLEQDGPPTREEHLWQAGADHATGGAVLSVSAAQVSKVMRDREATLLLSVCRAGNQKGPEATPFWVTAETGRGVVTLEDGIEVEATTVPKPADDSQPLWHDFRVLIPGGEFAPSDITISASSAGKVILFADTRHISHDPRTYRWHSEPNSSRPVLRLTTKPELASKETHLIDRRLPCFVYITAYAWTPGHAEKDTTFSIGTSSSKSLVLLREGRISEQSLPGGGTQFFHYRVVNPDSSVLFSVSTAEGELRFQASSRPGCPEDLQHTSPFAHDIILLQTSSPAFSSAVAEAATGSAPVLYLCVHSSKKEKETSFKVTARAVADAEVLRNGDMTTGAVSAGSYDRYRFWIDKPSAPTHVNVRIFPVTGSPSVFVSCGEEFPRRGHHDWAGELMGNDTVLFSTADSKFKPGWAYISVTAHAPSAYHLSVSWGNETMNLEDGVPEDGRISKDDTKRYLLEIEGRKEDGNPVAIRVNSLVGSVFVCVARESQKTCEFLAISSEQRPAALDLPFEVVRFGGRFIIQVTGRSSSNIFSLSACVDAPLLLTEGQEVVDSVAPNCCAHELDDAPQAVRLFRIFTVSKTWGDNVLVTLKPQEDSANLQGEQLGSVVLSAKRAPQTGAQSQSGSPVLQVVGSSTDNVMQLPVQVSKLLEGAPGAVTGAWVWIEVRSPRTLNFTIRAQKTNSITNVKGTVGGHQKPLQLLPGDPVPRTITTGAQDAFEFVLGTDTSQKAAAWSLVVRQCLGRVSVRVGKSSFEGDRNADLRVPLGVGNHSSDRIAIVAPIDSSQASESEKTSVYEIELKAPDVVSEPIHLPDRPVMTSAQNGVLLFPRSRIRKETLKSISAYLVYLVVMVPKSDDRLQAYSACGLIESMKHGAKVVPPEKVQATSQGMLQVQIGNTTGFLINVLVSLLDKKHERTLSVQSYEPFDPDARSDGKVLREPVSMVHILQFVMVCLVIGLIGKGLHRTSQRKGSRHRGFDEKREVQLDSRGHIDYTDFPLVDSRADENRPSRGYEPPKVDTALLNF